MVPAPGFRDSGWRGTNAGGTLYVVGYGGYSWSSTISTGSTSAHYLRFYFGGIYPNNYDNRAFGFQLRCLQE